MKLTPFAGRGDRARAAAPSFGHLAAHAGFLGLGGGRQARAEEPSDEQKRKDEDEARKARRAEEDTAREEEDARRAEEDQRREEEDARRAEEDGGAPDDKDRPDGKGKGNKAAGESNDDEEECEEEGDEDPKVRNAARAGRLAERARWSRTLGHANAGGRVATACTLLATSENGSASVIATLGTIPAQAGREPLGSRMSTVQAPVVGADAPRGGGRSPAATRAHEFLASAAAADPSRVHKPD